MIEEAYLPYFITEKLYIIKEDVQKLKSEHVPVSKNESAPVMKAPTKAEPAAPAIPKVTKPTPKIHELAVWTPPLTVADRELVGKILTAIGKDIQSAHLMEGIMSFDTHFKDLICFGYDKELEVKLKQPIKLHEPLKVGEQRIIVTLTPETLHSDPASKKALWGALQKTYK